ncbi:deoxyhypusine hydroxylase [Festucalex cinctus]
MASVEQLAAVGSVLVDPGQDLTQRFRALFTLKNLGGSEAVEWISKAFVDDSALLKHELAFCLGQMQDARAIPVLSAVLKDTRQEPMVRHEAGEALGAIGDPSVLDLLKAYSQDPVVEVAETCQLAVRRLEWLESGGADAEDVDESPYSSVDPAPPAARRDVSELRAALLDETLPLFERYRAMFALRNRGGRDAVLALGDGLRCSSALFRHEVGYVLGQMRDPAAVPALRAVLERDDGGGESAMVRHEAAEALGSIGRDDCLAVLRRFRGDGQRVVRESCRVALDMLDYENDGQQFQYADTLAKLQGSTPAV